MDPFRKQSWVWRSLAASGFVVLVCCGGLAYVIYRMTHTYVHTYQAVEPTTMPGAHVNLTVSVHHRITSDWGDSLVGPPYWFRLDVRHATERKCVARLHAVRIVRDDGRELTAEVTRGENQAVDGVTCLYAQIEHGDLGRTPRLFADIEVVMPETAVAKPGTAVRKIVEFPLIRHTTASLNIP